MYFQIDLNSVKVMIFMKERLEENSLKYYLSVICRSSRKIIHIVPMREWGNISLYNLREKVGMHGFDSAGGWTSFPWRSCCSAAQSYPTLSAIYPKVDMLDPMVILFWFFKETAILFSMTVAHCTFPSVVSSVQFSHSVVSNSLWPHGLQHARPPCPSPTPGPCSNSCPLSRWCHPTISTSVVPFSSHLQSFPASGSFQMSQLFASGG